MRTVGGGDDDGGGAQKERIDDGEVYSAWTAEVKQANKRPLNQ